jgi:hypothetical protein
MDIVSHNPTVEAESQAEPFFLYPENREFLTGELTKLIIRWRPPLLALFFYSVAMALCVMLIARLYQFYIFSPIATGFVAFPLAFAIFYLPSRLSHLRFLKSGKLLEGRIVASGFLKLEGVHLLLDITSLLLGRGPVFVGREYPAGPGDYHPWLRYIFRSPEGLVISAEEKIVAKNDRQLPERGAPVKVLYLSDRKYRLL